MKLPHSKAYADAKKYYPGQWDIDQLRNLVRNGKLRRDEFKEITGEDYTE